MVQSLSSIAGNSYPDLNSSLAITKPRSTIALKLLQTATLRPTNLLGSHILALKNDFDVFISPEARSSKVTSSIRLWYLYVIQTFDSFLFDRSNIVR
jgi:hypothetical protein